MPAKPSVNIPVKVVSQPTVHAAEPVAPPASVPKKSWSKPKLPSRPNLSITAAPEHIRRRIMWVAVAVIMVALFGSWLVGLKSGFFNAAGDHGFAATWDKIRGAFTTIGFKQESASAAEKEIRQLDQQVFPQLSK